MKDEPKIHVVVNSVTPENKDDCGIRVKLFVEDEKGKLKEINERKPEGLPESLQTRVEKIRMSCPAKVMTFTHL